MSIDDYTRWPRGLDYVRAGLDDLFRSNPYLAQVGAELADWGLRPSTSASPVRPRRHSPRRHAG
jgi:hypothetical protein